MTSEIAIASGGKILELNLITFEFSAVCLAIAGAIWWFFRSARVELKKPDIGTVYFVKAGTRSWFHKVGMTTRSFRERKREIERTLNRGNPVYSVAQINKMPFAWDVEQYFHKRIRRTRYHLKGRADNPNTRDRGREFYVLKSPDDVDFFLATLERAASDVRRVAKSRGRWPDGADEKATLVVWHGGRPSAPILLFASQIKFQEAAE